MRLKAEEMKLWSNNLLRNYREKSNKLFLDDKIEWKRQLNTNEKKKLQRKRKCRKNATATTTDQMLTPFRPAFRTFPTQTEKKNKNNLKKLVIW